MSLRSRLLLAGAPLAVAVALLGVLAVSSLGALGRTGESILADNYRSVLAAERMKEAVERLDDRLIESAVGGAALDPAAAAGERRRFGEELRVEENNFTEAGEPQAGAALRAAWTAYTSAFDTCAARPAPEPRRTCYFAEVDPRLDAVRAAADRILEINQDAMLRKSDAARREAEWRSQAMLAAAFAALAAGLVTSFYFAGRFLRPLRVFGQAVEQFGRGDFAVRALVRGRDEIAQLAATFNAMADRIEEYRRSSLGELAQAQLATQAAIDGLPDPVFQFALDGSLIASNAAAESVLGRGGSDLDAAPPAIRDAVASLRDHALQGKGAVVSRGLEDAIAVPGPDGERFFTPNAAPVYEEGLGVVGAAVVLRDVTALRRLDALRTDLVSTVAHQFRTPLTSLRMAIHLCLDGVAGPLSPKQDELLHAAREECERLQHLVEEILDLARLQSGSIDLELERTEADALLEELRLANEAAAESRGIALVREPSSPGLALRADRGRLGLALSNLVENALRHTPQGGRVVLRARENGALVRLEVADSGPGVPPEERERVFQKYARGSGKTGAAGLGLAIASEIVAAHGGAIGVCDALEGGACFWIELPAADGGPAAQGA